MKIVGMTAQGLVGLGKKALMLVSDFAMMDPGPQGESLVSRLSRVVARFFGFGDAPAPTVPGLAVRPPIKAADQNPNRGIHIVRHDDTLPSPSGSDAFRWRRHQQLLQTPVNALEAEERRARHHAVRGLYAAREGALSAAEDHFTRAAGCPDINFGDIPGFWQLNRSALMTAVRAYEAAGRVRDASALNARIRTQLRPRAITSVPANVTELPARRRLKMSGN